MFKLIINYCGGADIGQVSLKVDGDQCGRAKHIWTSSDPYFVLEHSQGSLLCSRANILNILIFPAVASS